MAVPQLDLERQAILRKAAAPWGMDTERAGVSAGSVAFKRSAGHALVLVVSEGHVNNTQIQRGTS